MRRHIYQISLSLALLLLLVAAVANAQSSGMLVANIPFDFHVGPAVLPSGTYVVKQPRPAIAGIFIIQARNGDRSVMALTRPGVSNKGLDVGKLVFNRYGDNYFLSEVQDPYDYATHPLLKSKMEKEIARNATSGGLAVAVALEKR